MTDDNSLIKKLKMLRAQKGWSQQVLADRSGIGISTIKSIESGATDDPRSETLKTLADTLGVTTQYLRDGDGQRFLPRKISFSHYDGDADSVAMEATDYLQDHEDRLIELENHLEELLKAFADIETKLQKFELASDKTYVPPDLLDLFSTFTNKQWNHIRSEYGLPKVKEDSKEDAG